MRVYNEHLLTFLIDFGKRKSENCIHGQNPQRRRDFAGTGLARGSCRQCIHWYLMYNGAYHKNLGALGRYVESQNFGGEALLFLAYLGNAQKIYCTAFYILANLCPPKNIEEYPCDFISPFVSKVPEVTLR